MRYKQRERETGTQTRYVYGVEEYHKKYFQHFSCLLDEGNAKMCKKLDSHDGFLRADKDRGKSAAGWAGLAVLSCR